MATRFNEFDTVYAPPGEAIDDGGASYESIQDAVDNTDSWVLAGPGEFNEELVIDKDGLSLIGSGKATKIIATDNAAVAVEASDVVVSGVSVEQTVDQFSSALSFRNGDGGLADNVTVVDSNAAGIEVSFNSADTILSFCTVESAAEDGIRVSDQSVVANCRVFSSGGPWSGIFLDDTCSAFGNYVQSPSGNGMLLETDCLAVGNYVISAGSNGIVANGSRNEIVGGFVTGSSGNDLAAGDNVPRDNKFTGVSHTTHNLGSEPRNVLNGRYVTPETVSLGGSDGVVSPVDNGLQMYDIEVDAGGSASNLQGIDTIAQQGVTANLYHTGGETVTLEHNASVTNPLLNQGAANFDLAANGQFATYLYDGSAWREVASNTV